MKSRSMFRTRYIVLVALGGALAYTYRRALSDHVDGDPGWLSFVAVWLPAAILLGLAVAYIAPAVAWRIRGSRASASAGRERSVFSVGGSFYLWVAPFAFAAVGGALLARGDYVAGVFFGTLALVIRPLHRRFTKR
jgi:hypothetical protein